MVAIIDHEFIHSPYRKIGLLLPLGEWKNKKILELPVGAEVSDIEGALAKIVAKTVISGGSMVAECLAYQLYGCSIGAVKKTMQKRTILDDDEDKILYLIIDLV